MRIIFESKDKRFRIVEHADLDCSLEDLKGDCFNPTFNTDIPAESLVRQEREFEDLVNREGVFGYVLEQWNPAPGEGYEHVDSCWGFVGQYSETDETFAHYIVDEMIQTILKLAA